MWRAQYIQLDTRAFQLNQKMKLNREYKTLAIKICEKKNNRALKSTKKITLDSQINSRYVFWTVLNTLPNFDDSSYVLSRYVSGICNNG